MAKMVYPVVLTPAGDGMYDVYSPDFDRNTQGKGLADALEMAEDMMSLMGVVYEDDGEAWPEPSSLESVEIKGGQLKTLVAVDFEAYRRKNSLRAVKKTLSIPSWLNTEAEEAGVNFSATLQEALKAKLGIGA